MGQTPNYSIDNATGAGVRSDLNDVFDAIVTNNSGTVEPVPSPTGSVPKSYAYMLWADTTSSVNKLKIRNGANTAWIEVGDLDQVGLNIVASKFPNVTTSVTRTSAQLNDAVYLPSGTKMVFYQTAVPVGWAIDATHNDKALRVVDNTTGNEGGGSGGSSGLSAGWSHAHGVSGTTNTHTLTTAQVPAHKHNFVNDDNIGSAAIAADGVTKVSSYGEGGSDGSGTLYKFTTDSVGGGGSHSHVIPTLSTSTVSSIHPLYIDVIVCTKS